jgi:hypothetical protein
MAQSRYINTRFWKDNYVVELNPSDKLLFLYLITNQNTNIAGIYEISPREMAMDTGFNQDAIMQMLERFRADGKVYYVEGHIIVRNFMNHQSDNQKIQQGMANIIDKLPPRLRKFIVLDDAGLWLDSGELKGDLTLLTPKINTLWLDRTKSQVPNKQRPSLNNKYNNQQRRGL